MGVLREPWGHARCVDEDGGGWGGPGLCDLRLEGRLQRSKGEFL